MRMSAMRGPAPNRRVVWRPGPGETAVLAIAAVAALVPLITGCAGRSPAEAENREIRVTKDGAVKYSPRFSPDGSTIAYCAATASESGAFGVFLVPQHGGEPRRISPDSLSAYPIGWTADGDAIYCRNMDGRGVNLLGLDGSVRRVDTGDALVRTAAISPDGKTLIQLKFNQDNRDLGILEAGGEFKFIAATPVWEEEAVLGPAPDEITVVTTPSYQAQTSTISVWSPKTQAFTALPLPEGQKFHPAWSADGRMLAYSYRREGQADLWLYDARNAKSAPLTGDPEDCASPNWSPDGEWIAFSRSTKISHIYAGHPRKEGRRQITEGPDYDSAPMVSPDGRWVVFLRKFAGGEERGKTALFVVAISGGPARRLDLKGLTIPGKGGEAMAWSPDAAEIAFQASEGGARMDIYRIGREGGGLARVTVEPGDEVEPRWSADGKHISYTRVGGGQTRVAVVPASGGLPRVLSPEGMLSEGGLVAPGSERMVYVTFRSDGTSELWMTQLAAPEKRTLLNKSKQFVWPVHWTRDGQEIILMRGQGTAWQVIAFSADSRTEKTIGRTVMLPSGKDWFAELLPEGSMYEPICYPGGIVAADGQDRSDLYLIRARMPDKPTALYLGEDRLLRSGFVGLAGYF